jgi:hypothetical protein
VIAFAVVHPTPSIAFATLEAAMQVFAILVVVMARGLVENDLEARQGCE